MSAVAGFTARALAILDAGGQSDAVVEHLSSTSLTLRGFALCGVRIATRSLRTSGTARAPICRGCARIADSRSIDYSLVGDAPP